MINTPVTPECDFHVTQPLSMKFVGDYLQYRGVIKRRDLDLRCMRLIKSHLNPEGSY